MNQAQPSITTARRWRLRVMTVLLAMLPFLLIEIGLRVLAPAAADQAIVDPTLDLQNLQPLFERNQTGGRWEIPASRSNFFQPDSFLIEKPPNSRRIFVLGGSTVQGRPYSIETSFSSWLKLRLQAASPDASLEVVNCGGVSYASYRVAKILEEVLQHQPDAIVIYTGHNEFLEDREYADVRAMEEYQRQLAGAASKIRMVTWIKSRFESEQELPSNIMTGEVDARLDHAGGLKRYVRDDDWRAAVESHFASTLQQMIRMTQAADVPLILCAPCSDLVNTPPFKSELPPVWSLSQRTDFEAAWATVISDAAKESEREAACEECLRLDSKHAGANYAAGIRRYQSGDALQAKQLLVAARDQDVCPLRATTPIVNAVIRLAEQHQVPLVRITRHLDQTNHDQQRIPDGIADPQFFVDHVHPTVAGHQEIAALVVAQMTQLEWFETMTGADERYRQLVQEHLSVLGEDYFARGEQRLQGLRRWAAGRAGELLP
ncbi:MAG: hypothetical protein AB8B91_15085 [Rubripirellula sp.]